MLGDVKPDLTIILDLPVAAGLARAIGRGGLEARFESKSEVFHERLRQAFLAIAAAEPKRCRVLDGTAAVGDVAAAVWNAVSSCLASA